MKIIIPTRGRHDVIANSTLSRIPDSLLPATVLWCHRDEEIEYMDAAEPWIKKGLKIVSTVYRSIGEKRLQIGEWCDAVGIELFCMIDDDVDFLIRKGDYDWRLEAQTEEQTVQMFSEIEHWLTEGYAQVAISPREGNNQHGIGDMRGLVAECTRAMRITAYRTEDFLSVEHDRVPVMEDFDVLLQLLRSGRKNLLLAYFANGQKKTNAPGGCSLWRTLDLHNAAVERMAELHPGFVKVREKKNKTDADGFGTRKEVTVYWKKAFASSQIGDDK